MGWQVLDLVWSNSTFPIDNKQEFASTEKWSQTGAARKNMSPANLNVGTSPTPRIGYRYTMVHPNSHGSGTALPLHGGVHGHGGTPKIIHEHRGIFRGIFPFTKTIPSVLGYPLWQAGNIHMAITGVLHTWSSGRCLQRSDPTISRPLLGSSGRPRTGEFTSVAKQGISPGDVARFHWMIKKQGWNLWRNMDLMKKVTWYIQPMNWMF